MTKFNNNPKFAEQQPGQAIQLVLPEFGTTSTSRPSLKPKSLRKDKLTTEELQKLFNIPEKIVRKCPVGKAIPWGCYLIWHQGRDKWRVYQQIAA